MPKRMPQCHVFHICFNKVMFWRSYVFVKGKTHFDTSITWTQTDTSRQNPCLTEAGEQTTEIFEKPPETNKKMSPRLKKNKSAGRFFLVNGHWNTEMEDLILENGASRSVSGGWKSVSGRGPGSGGAVIHQCRVGPWANILIY